MQNTKIQHNLVWFSGNKVGFISEGTAILDAMFQNPDLEQWLLKKEMKVSWREGIFERLLSLSEDSPLEQGRTLKNVRIWRLKKDFPMEARFLFLEELRSKFGEPVLWNYDVIYKEAMGTENLDMIFKHFSQENSSIPAEFEYPLSISDVIELFDHGSREFYYIDRYNFVKIPFL